ncbi:MAG: hypothetical protein NWF07_11740 [Candidatus Bathyarchaeota archaeon]|nr:hypothetical protein [Candidatus Bathyarchaeota archaeon]
MPTTSMIPLKMTSFQAPIQTICTTSKPTNPTKNKTIKPTIKTNLSLGTSSLNETRLVEPLAETFRTVNKRLIMSNNVIVFS